MRTNTKARTKANCGSRLPNRSRTKILIEIVGGNVRQAIAIEIKLCITLKI